VFAVLLAAWATALGAGSQPPAAVDALYAKARTEREVVLWGAQDRELDWIPAEFARRFPGIEVKWAADRSAVTKAITEQRAGRHAVDVIHFSIGGMLPMVERRMLEKHDWSTFAIAPRDVLLDGTTVATHNLVYSIVYNDKLVAPADLPKTWEDLLAPKWKGKTVASQFLLPRLLGFLALEWGEAKAADYARALIDGQGMLVTRAPREGILQRGERTLAVGEFVSSALHWKSLGMPVAWTPMPLMPAAQFGASVLARAPHPHAARLLAGWLATPEAKLARERLRFDADVRPGSSSTLAATLARAGGRLVIEDVTNMKARAASYERLSAIVTARVR
jgi:iron(III) transport system substrate-binding protein